MRIQHSTELMVNQLASKQAHSSEATLALVAKMRAQMSLEIKSDKPLAPENTIEAAEQLIDKEA